MKIKLSSIALGITIGVIAGIKDIKMKKLIKEHEAMKEMMNSTYETIKNSNEKLKNMNDATNEILRDYRQEKVIKTILESAMTE